MGAYTGQKVNNYMEKNENMEVESVTTEEQTEERLFTSEEVSKIVQSRLAKLKKKNEQKEEHESTLDKREKEVQKRELRAKAVEQLKEKNVPSDFIDLVNLDNEEVFKKSIDLIERLGNKYIPKTSKRKVDVLDLESDSLDRPDEDLFKTAFAPKFRQELNND